MIVQLSDRHPAGNFPLENDRQERAGHPAAMAALTDIPERLIASEENTRS